MTRRECEKAIVKKLREIWDIYQQYHPGGDWLNVYVTDHSAAVFNAYWSEDELKPLDYYVLVEEVGADANDER
jgi:hypothetical protein